MWSIQYKVFIFVFVCVHLPEFSSFTSEDIALVTESAATNKSFLRLRVWAAESDGPWNACRTSPPTPVSEVSSGVPGVLDDAPAAPTPTTGLGPRLGITAPELRRLGWAPIAAEAKVGESPDLDLGELLGVDRGEVGWFWKSGGVG